MTTLCRNCFHMFEEDAPACPSCGHERLVRNSRLAELGIAHLDCDAFFAAIEKRDDPSLKNKPVIVGGGKRGVVATCCYIARLYGVRSAMPMFQALKACPDAVVIKPNSEKYRIAGLQVREKMQALTPMIQPVSVDEAYLDLTGTNTLHKAPPAVSLARLAAEIERDVGITVSIGLSVNKFLAKTASELDKPKGFAVIAAEEAEALLAPKPIGFIHGIGPKLAKKLSLDGYDTIEDLQRTELRQLIGKYGETGMWLKNRAHGIDNRPVRNDEERKSVSSETTFHKDMSDTAWLEDQLWRLCVKTADRAKATGLVGNVITLKLKTADFRTLTRRLSLAEPTQLAQTLFRSARILLAKEANGRTRFRLIGIGISDLSEHRADSVDLLDPLVAKRAAAERASDLAREKFGADAVMTGRSARAKKAAS
ncbi:MAG TPA: DNA polymerase IV [Hyphomonas atlantica]|uniref:DNA polymerase IV n=1 Tax=Hyphomonas atlantica TaxID=1280948 RepID=A0A356W4V3_9PROT|nr:DNA polymerase IV [Hyphomonas atlantica]HAE95613.1 DNA polymerase IV [Hyphomonas atlantica]HBQ48647.1 DNA polymerase IV [Hyphomonas atlantica]|tara:strand:+ start:2294 stop:3565 length:1272 start_codon:yes stop_codon:yes gene_type:complete